MNYNHCPKSLAGKIPDFGGQSAESGFEQGGQFYPATIGQFYAAIDT
jgi:hypothetical protein